MQRRDYIYTIKQIHTYIDVHSQTDRQTIHAYIIICRVNMWIDGIVFDPPPTHKVWHWIEW